MQTSAHGGRDPFTLDDRGVWFTPLVNGEEGKPQWVCAPLHVTARTRDDAANGWGYLLEFSDPDGNPKQWAMPVAMLSGEGSEWAARLADMGLDVVSRDVVPRSAESGGGWTVFGSGVWPTPVVVVHPGFQLSCPGV